MIRHVPIPFFVLYSDAYGACRDDLLNARDWEGIAQEMAYWSQKPTERRHLRRRGPRGVAGPAF